MKHTLLILIMLLFAVDLRAKEQVSKTDSIKKLIATDLKSPKTTGKANIDRINQLAEQYYESHPDSTLKYANMAVAFAGRSGYNKGIADGHANIALVNLFRGEYPLSTQGFNKALQLHRSVRDEYGVSEDMIGLGRVNDFLGDYQQALEHFRQALAIRQKLGNDSDIADCYNFIGITYDNKGEYSKALDHYLRSLSIYMKQHNELASADSYCNIGIIMQHLQLYPKALDYFDIALKIWVKHQDDQGISTIYLNNGEVYMAQKRYAEAFSSFQKASRIFHDMEDREGISLVYYDLGICYQHRGQPDSALFYLNKALMIASTDKIKYNQLHAYLGLAKVHNAQGNYIGAYTYASLARHLANTTGGTTFRAEAAFELSKALAGSGNFKGAYQEQHIYSTLKDSADHNSIIERLAAYDLERTFAKDQLEYKRRHQAEIVGYETALKQQHYTIIIYAIIAILTATIAFVYYNGKRKQTKINHQLTEKNAEILAQRNSLDEHSHKLNELNHLKDRLIALLAHDLRAPLSTLRGLFNLMADKEVSPEEFADMAPKVFTRLENTSDFLDTLLFWINSQVDGATNISTFSLYDKIRKEMSMLDLSLQQKKLTVINHIDKADTVSADPNSIRIVVHNFLTNAIKFSNVGGKIEVSSYLSGDGHRVFKMTDQGVGIPADKLKDLFKNKVKSTPGTNAELGTGMGLLFCKDLVDNNKGRIWAESESGKGTTLYFSLPVSDTATVPASI